MLSNRRKKKLLGTLCIVLSALIALAVVSYAPSDDAAVAALLEAGHPAHGTSVQNWLGLPGAVLAWILVPRFMGYIALVWCALGTALGWHVLRRQRATALPRLALFSLAGAAFACFAFGWLGHAFGVSTDAWAGALGNSMAAGAIYVLGTAGTFVVGVVLAFAFGLYLRTGSAQAAATRVASQATTAVSTIRARGPRYARYAVQWLRARYTDANVDPMAPLASSERKDQEREEQQRDEQHGKEESKEEDAETPATPTVKDPTAPKASGFRLVKKSEKKENGGEAEASAPSSVSSAPPQADAAPATPAASSDQGTTQARTSAPDARAVPDPASPSRSDSGDDAASAPNEASSEESSESEPSGFDEVRERVRRINERMQHASNDDTSTDSAPAHPDAPVQDRSGARADEAASEASAGAPEATPASNTPLTASPPDAADALFEDAAYLVVRYQDASTAFVRRMLGIGSERAARIADQLERSGVIGAGPDTGTRTVRVSESHDLDAWFASE